MTLGNTTASLASPERIITLLPQEFTSFNSTATTLLPSRRPSTANESPTLAVCIMSFYVENTHGVGPGNVRSEWRDCKDTAINTKPYSYPTWVDSERNISRTSFTDLNKADHSAATIRNLQTFNLIVQELEGFEKRILYFNLGQHHQCVLFL